MAASIGLLLAQLQHGISARLSEQSDAVLLERFVQQRDESAFAALVARHGEMVFRSCRRVLGDAHAAEDAFQAVFLILARKAHTLRQPAALPGYLHSVARRVALKARRGDMRPACRGTAEPRRGDMRPACRGTAEPAVPTLPDPHPDPLTQLTARELLDILDEEVARLPAAQRSAVVLCCLEGHTREEAAKLLGCPPGSVKGHLERGRQRLQARLQRRGIALSAALAFVAVSRGEMAPVLLLHNTIRTALHGGIGGSASTLAHGVLQAMFLTKLAGVGALVLMLALTASATIALVYRNPAAEAPENPKPVVAAAPKDVDTSNSQARLDALGDPLPEGAIARLGTVRLRHGGWIRFAAFTPDGKRLVSQGTDGVRIWDTSTGKQLRHLDPKPGMMWGASDQCSDGKTLAAAIESSDGQIDLWDISSGQKTVSFGHGYYDLVCLSPDGRLLAAHETAKAWLREAQLWDVASQRKLRAWKPHGRQQVLSLAFSADSKKLLTSGAEGKLRLWDTATGRQLQEFTRLDWKFGDSLWFFNQNEALSPDGKLLALVELSEKGTPKSNAIPYKARISLRDTTTGKHVSLLACSHEVASGRIRDFGALTFTPQSKKLITAGPDRFLRVWDVATREELRRWPLEMACPYSLALSKDGRRLAIVNDQGKSLQLLDMTTGMPPISWSGHRTGVGWTALTPDNRTAVTVSRDGIAIWDLPDARMRHRFGEHAANLAGMQLDRDGRTLYTLGGEEKTVRVWDLIKGEELRRFSMGQEYMPSAFGALALSPDSGILAVLSSKSIRLLDAKSGRELRRFAGPEWVEGSAFAADGRFFVVWSGDLKVAIWDTTKGRLLREYPLPPELRLGQPVALSGPSPVSYHAALSPDSRLLAVGNDRHSLPLEKCFLEFKDLATGRDIRRVDHLPADVLRIAFSPDGRVLAWSGSKDWSIHLMETASGRERGCFSGHRGQVFSLIFSADSRRLISGSMDTTALVWELTGQVGPRQAATLTKKGLDSLWADLASDDAALAYRAISQLATAPNAAVPFLRERLRPVPSVEGKHIDRLTAELDSNDFAVRQKAAAELQELGDRAMATYRKALNSKPSLESRRRLDDLLEKSQLAWWEASGTRLRLLRSIEVLELAGTKEAREVLEALAAGAEGARLTEEAKAALKRLAKKQ